MTGDVETLRVNAVSISEVGTTREEDELTAYDALIYCVHRGSDNCPSYTGRSILRSSKGITSG